MGGYIFQTNTSIIDMTRKKFILLSASGALFAIFCLFFIIRFGHWAKRAYHYAQMDHADVYIQAGHEGRTRGSTGASSAYGREIDWTPIVADEATRVLRAAGYEVIRAPADHYKRSKVDLALSIHFDGSVNPCNTGASIGYDDPTDKPAADAWKALYDQYFPYKWMPDNFTRNLSHYYNYHYTITRDAELLLELGDISCKKQANWLKPRLKNIGGLLAYFAAERVDGNTKGVPEPKAAMAQP